MSRFTDFISGKPPKPVEVVVEEPIQEVVVKEPVIEEAPVVEEEPAQQTYKTTTKKRKRSWKSKKSDF